MHRGQQRLEQRVQPLVDLEETYQNLTARNALESFHDAQQALDMGLVNTIVPVEQLEAEGVQWASEILEKSPIAIRFLKAAMNADLDGQTGGQVFAGAPSTLHVTLDHMVYHARAVRRGGVRRALGEPGPQRVRRVLDRVDRRRDLVRAGDAAR